MSNFGNKLRLLRKKKGLTQKQLADKLGLAFSTISMYERGDREPDFEILESIADFFNVSMDYLHGKSSSNNSTDDDIKFALFNSKDGITDEILDEVKEFAKFVKSKYKK